MKKGRRRINIGSTMLIGTVMILSTTNPSAISLGHCIPGIVGAFLVFSGIIARATEDVPQNEPTVESFNIVPAPESQTVPVIVVPDAPVPVFVDPPRPDAPPTYGGGVPFQNPLTVATDSIVDTAVTKPIKSKQRFCKYCGGAIDPTTKECSKCGKPTYLFKIKKSTVWVILAVLLIGYLVALNVFQYLKYQELKELSYDLEEQCQSLNELAGYYDDIIDALDSNELGEASSTFKSSRHYMVVGADEEDRRFTLTAHDLDEDSITVSYSSDAAKVSFDEDEWKKKVNVEVIPRHPGVTVVTFEDDKSGDSFAVLIIVTE